MNDSKDKLNSLVCFLVGLEDEEEFREITFIDNVDGKYFVSNKGRVLSLCRNVPKILKPFVCGNQGNNKGYQYITIGDRDYKISILVAKAFIPNPDNKPIVDHINEDKHCNIVSNLQWLTQSENLHKHWNKHKLEYEE